MAEDTPNDAATTPKEAPVQPRLQVVTQYIRDLSFENVAIQKGTKLDGKPDVQVQVAIDANKRAEDQYEVINKIKVESKSGGEVIFAIELDYAGLFKVENVPAEQLHPFLMIECPRMIFPYIRRIVGDVTRDGGFPPLNIDSIDYLNIYRQELARRQAAKASEGNGAAKTDA